MQWCSTSDGIVRGMRSASLAVVCWSVGLAGCLLRVCPPALDLSEALRRLAETVSGHSRKLFPDSRKLCPATHGNCFRRLTETVSGDSRKLFSATRGNCFRPLTETVSGHSRKLFPATHGNCFEVLSFAWTGDLVLQGRWHRYNNRYYLHATQADGTGNIFGEKSKRLRIGVVRKKPPRSCMI